MKLLSLLAILGYVLANNLPITDFSQCLKCHKDKDQKVCTSSNGDPICCDKKDKEPVCKCKKSTGQLWSCPATPMAGGDYQMDLEEGVVADKRSMGKIDSLTIIRFKSEKKGVLKLTTSGNAQVVRLKSKKIQDEKLGGQSEQELRIGGGYHVVYIGINSLDYSAFWEEQDWKDSSSTLLIILLIIGGVVLIAAIAIGVCICKRKAQGTSTQGGHYSQITDEEQRQINKSELSR